MELCKKVNLVAYTNSSVDCPREDAQCKRKKPSHVQKDYINKVVQF